MSNTKKHALDELELLPNQINEVLRCILHTILFVRAPGPVRPRETDCEMFSISYAKIDVQSVDRKVDLAIEDFTKHLDQREVSSDPFRSQINVYFFEKRQASGFLSVLSKPKKFRWEHWAIPIVINRPLPVIAGSAEADEVHSHNKRELESSLQQCVLKVLENAQHIDHVPPVMYEYEILHGDPDARSTKSEPISKQILNSPKMLIGS